MKLTRTHFKAALTALPLLLTSLRAFAAPPYLTHQGRLFTNAGDPVSGDVKFVFTLYASKDGTDSIWTETQTISLEDGYFSTILGQQTPIDGKVFDGTMRYLGIAINDSPELTPRETIASVPYALNASIADNATGDITPKTVSVGGKVVIDANGNWVGPTTGLVGTAGPQGPAGTAGAAGPQGPAGPTGAAGTAAATGATGATGPAGVAGQPGATGPLGPIGPQGAKGATGAAGGVGAQGATGPAGAPGTAGPQGPIGPQGLAGTAGAKGATGAAGATGATGTAGAPGAAGPQGPIGPQGAAGTPGTKGATGATGATGPQGLQGPLGPLGPQGVQGPQGPQGAAGVKGATGVGITGPQGPSGFISVTSTTGAQTTVLPGPTITPPPPVKLVTQAPVTLTASSKVFVYGQVETYTTTLAGPQTQSGHLSVCWLDAANVQQSSPQFYFHPYYFGGDSLIPIAWGFQVPTAGTYTFSICGTAGPSGSNDGFGVNGVSMTTIIGG